MNKLSLDLNNQNIGFTSDLHCFHKNIIKFSNRGFNNVLEMNEALRDNHNKIFNKNDIIFNLGDMALIPKSDQNKEDTIKKLDSLLSTFNGKIYYIPGNHEKQLGVIKRHWTVLPQLFEVEIKEQDIKQLIILCHYALRVWNASHYGSWHLFAHSHGTLKSDTNENMQEYKKTLSMDVGVDTNNFYPYTYDDIKNHMKTKTFSPIDHHNDQ